ncbi:SMP-30/gluconolactonase/LRE family protein [Saccharothrix variisporea]|uniref:Sugar lactone lactonase YvrE n=1 Tax=Saccharothrix variisporea TaxID=543527 RepID=A0A495X6R1_9PSEU|nr:SMP-30/gluconolactonase/LRE family protein [Saccharothrix variisporea]RKT67188.1 sugar lactone lactonase YvrE [Saccharothrix variisporea]
MPRRLISPRRWRPTPIQDTGPTGPLTILRRLPTGGHGPEDVLFDGQGRVVTGLADGRVVAVDPETGERTVLGTTGGRPLGLEVCADGTVLVCDHDRGLLRISTDVEVLVNEVDGKPLTFASNVVQGPDGTIWFTTSTSRWHLDHYEGDMLEHSRTGRLLRRDPDGTVTTLLDTLAFANGLVLTPTHLLYAETGAYRISRYDLATGTTGPFVDNLPGFPDNMSLGSDGLLWVAIAAPRNPLLDKLLPLPGFLRLLVWNLPTAIRPKATPVAWVMAFDQDGNLVHDLRSTTDYGFVTSVAEHNGTLVLGSLHENDLALLPTP